MARVVVKSFGVNPKSVQTLGSTKVSWNVTIPDTAVDITLELNGAAVPPAGSKSFPLVQTTAFRLAATTEHAGRQLRTATVTVDSSACQVKVLDAFIVTQSLKRALQENFGSGDKLKVKEPGPEVVLSAGTISMSLRLTINVPNWFDADMNITIQLAVLGGSDGIRVTSKGLFVNVKWGFFEHLASLFCTGFVQSGMEQLAKEFLDHIVNAELAPGIASALNEQRLKFVTDLKEADPQHREFVMTFVKVAADGISITACPK